MRDAFGRVQSVAVIGGTSDIGLACARELLTKSGRLILAGRDRVSLTAALADARFDGEVVDLDVSAPETHAAAIEEVFSGGDVDVVLLAAGVLEAQDRAAHEVDRAVHMATVNGVGSLSVMLEVASHLRDQGHGHLVVLSSFAVVRPRPDNYLYGSSKAMLDFAARGLADDLRGSAVRVTTVRPGFVHTKMTRGMKAAPFSVSPAAVARSVAAEVAADRSGVVWVPKALAVLAMVVRAAPMALLRRLG